MSAGIFEFPDNYEQPYNGNSGKGNYVYRVSVSDFAGCHLKKTVKTCLIFEYQYTRDAWSCLSLDLFLKKSTVFRGTSLSLERELEVLSRELRTASSTTPTTLHTGESVNRGNAFFTVRRCSRHDMQVREVMKTAWAARLPVVAFRGFHGLNPSLPSARSLCFLVGLLPVLCVFCSNQACW